MILKKRIKYNLKGRGGKERKKTQQTQLGAVLIKVEGID